MNKKEFSHHLILLKNTVQFDKMKFIKVRSSESFEGGESVWTLFLLSCGNKIVNHPAVQRYNKN